MPWPRSATLPRPPAYPPPRPDRPHLNVTITSEEFCAGIGGRYLDTDQPVSPATLGVLKCDSAYHRLLIDGASGILDYGRATRAWPVDIYNAIVLRDGGCRFGGCDAPASWCDVHHVLPWDTAAKHRSPTGCWAAAATTASSTNRATRSSCCPTAPPSSPTPMAGSNQPPPRHPSPHQFREPPDGS